MLNAIYFYRVSRWLYLHHIPVLPKLITLLIFLIYNSKIPYQAKIGRESTFGYGGMGVVIHSKSIIGENPPPYTISTLLPVVIHSKSIIGENCTICQQVTIGGGNSRFPGVPVIGNNVYIAKGSIVMGGITIGNNVTIGANAVVTKPVPDNAIVAGVPAKILRIKE